MSSGEASRDSLFRDRMIAEERHPPRVALRWGISVATHALVVTLALLPLVRPRALQEVAVVRLAALVLEPGAPPPPRGGGRALATSPVARVAPSVSHERVEPNAEAAPIEDTPPPAPNLPQDAQAGGPAGSAPGDPNGVLGGDGEAGGRRNGCTGCAGESPVGDYDRAPQLTLRTQPIYPQEAFVKRTEGTVVLEILIDSMGNVANVRITSSTPLFDKAATNCVLQWKFNPALKHGRAVAALAVATVTFRIH